MLLRVVKILFHSLVFKEMLVFSVLVGMDMAMQLERINIDLEGPYLDMYTRSKGILSEISFSYLDLNCMSQLFMTALMYDLILTPCILKKACLKHSIERAKLFHHRSLWDKGTHGFLWLLRNIWPTIPDRKPGVPDHHYSCLRRLDIFVWPSPISFRCGSGEKSENWNCRNKNIHSCEKAPGI